MAKQRKPLQYKTYSGERGSPEQWRQTAMKRFGLIVDDSIYLRLLGFSTMPTLPELTKRWKDLMKVNHPDKGGSLTEAKKLNMAYDQLKRIIKERSPKSSPKPTEINEELILARPIDLDGWDRVCNDDYIAERKWDGHRYTLHIDKTMKLLSKHLSKVTGEYTDKAEHIPHITGASIDPKFYGTILDLEVVHPVNEKANFVTSILGSSPHEAIRKQKEQGWLRLKVFYCIKKSGQDLRQITLKENKQILKTLVEELQQYIPIEIVDDVPGSIAKEFYEKIILMGGEGIVLKKLMGLYGEEWWRKKNNVTYDVIITGFKEAKPGTNLAKNGLIGSIEFGIFTDQGIIQVGCCSGMEYDIRVELSENKEANIGRVIEISCQERIRNSFRNPQFERFRDDKPSFLCI